MVKEFLIFLLSMNSVGHALELTRTPSDQWNCLILFWMSIEVIFFDIKEQNLNVSQGSDLKKKWNDYTV